MPSGPEQASRSGNDASGLDETTMTNFRVSGKLPAALSGQYLQIGPNPVEGMVHAVTLDAGRVVSYRNGWIRTDGQDLVAANVVAFGSSILALGDGVLACELSQQLDII